LARFFLKSANLNCAIHLFNGHMTTFTAGITVGTKDICIFSMSPLTKMTPQHASDLAVAMAYLCDKVNANIANLSEVFTIHKQLIKALGPDVYVELEKPAQIGLGYIVECIGGSKVKPYFRQE